MKTSVSFKYFMTDCSLAFGQDFWVHFIVKFIVTSKNFIYTFCIFSTIIYFILIIFILFAFYLTFVLTKTWNEPKRPKTNQNEPKPAEAT